MHNYKLLVTVYFFLILINCGGGGGDDAVPLPGSSEVFKPDTIIGLNAIARSKTSIILEWGILFASGTSDSFNIYRDGALIDNTTDNTFYDADLLINTSYSYQVTLQRKVFDLIRESDLSEVLITNTLSVATEVPSSPSTLSVQSRTADSIYITWNDNSSNNEEGFNVYRDDKLIDTVLFDNRRKTHESTGLTFNTNYDFKITAFNDAGESLPIEKTFITRREPVKPASPTGVSVLSATVNTITLGFIDNANNEDGYAVFINNARTSKQLCRGQNLKECIIEGLTPKTE